METKTELKLTWRQVFDTNHRHWPFMEQAADYADICGYRYFCWNGDVMYTWNSKPTGLTTEDVL